MNSLQNSPKNSNLFKQNLGNITPPSNTGVTLELLGLSDRIFPGVLIDACACDYLRVGSFYIEDKNSFELVFDVFTRTFQDLKPGRFRQYVGYRSGSAFYGHAQQNMGDKFSTHWILEVSGAPADGVFDFLVTRPGRIACTRVDFQITIPKPVGYIARSFKDALDQALDGSKTPERIMIEGTEGLDTVYVHSRTSERFSRFYVKRLQTGVNEFSDYLRFEVEYKKPLSANIFSGWGSDGLSKRDMLLDYFDRLPVLSDVGYDTIKDYLGLLTTGLERPRKLVEISNTMLWLEKQVFPSMERLLNDHDFGSMLFDRLYKMLSEHLNYE